MERCPICREWKHTSHHICPPKWYVVFVDEEPHPGQEMEDIDNRRPTYAHTASAAAEKRVAQWDDGELAYDEDEVAVVVYDKDGLNPQTFDVQGGTQRVYNAIERRVRQTTPA